MTRAAPERTDQLSPRQIDCLRLIYDRRTSKEIAAVLGIAPGTVDGYIAEAVRVLGARNRRDAAERLCRREEAAAPRISPTENPGVPPAPPPPASDAAGSEPAWLALLPLRHKDARFNDLSLLTRLVWIPVLAALLAIGFGSLASGIRIIDDLVRR